MCSIVCTKRQEIEQYKLHQLEVDELKHQDPQPFLLSLEELNKSLTELPNMMYVPSVTVLHRCQGCGTDPEICTHDIVELEFYEYNAVRDEKTIIKVNATNHTTCNCTPKPIENNSTIKSSPYRRISVQEHVTIVSNFGCYSPITRLTPLESFMTPRSDMIYTPPCAVIKQCVFNPSYCAEYNHRYCHTVQKENITLHFQERLVNSSYFNIFNITIEQDMSCCQNLNGIQTLFPDVNTTMEQDKSCCQKTNKVNQIFLVFLELFSTIVFILSR